MNREALFPDAHREGQQTRVEQAWDLSWPLPIPRFAMRCPRCAFPEAPLVLKDWRFHRQDAGGSKSPWRCDVRLKCVDCSLVLTFGVPVSEAHLAAAPARGWISWRQGKQALADAGFFDT